MKTVNSPNKQLNLIMVNADKAITIFNIIKQLHAELKKEILSTIDEKI